MAVGAIIDNRTVFPEKRTALLGVAGVAGLVDRVLDEELRSRRSVRVVTIRAHHFADEYRMRRNAMDLRALRLVADETDIRLSKFGEDRVVGRMDRMAVTAGHTAALMLASGPVRARQDF